MVPNITRKLEYEMPLVPAPSGADFVDMLNNIPGILITGESGAGKSTTVRHIIRKAAADGETAVFVFDPHSTLIQDCISDVLDASPSVRDRTLIVAPGNRRFPVLPINPLYVARSDSDYEYRARLSVVAEHFSHMLLSLFGDGSFEGRPNQFKYSTMISHCLADMGLSPADYFHFFPGSPIYDEFIQSLPDPIAREEFLRIGELDTFQASQLIASTETRFSALFNRSPVMESHLGVSDPERCANIRQMIDGRAILLGDFAGLGQMTPRQSAMLVNVWLSQVLFTIFNTPPEERRPVLVVADELPVVAEACGPLLVSSLPQTRKMLFRFVGLFQNVNTFAGGVDNPLLRCLVDLCNKIVMRHRGDVDTEFWGKILSIPNRDPTKVKFEHYEQEQFTLAMRKVCLVNYGITDQWADGSSGSDGGGTNEEVNVTRSEADGNTLTEGEQSNTTNQVSEGESLQHGTGLINQDDLIRESLNEARSKTRQKSQAEAFGRNRSVATQNTKTNAEGSGRGTNNTWSRTWNTQRSGSRSYSYNETLSPIYAWRSALRFIEFLSLDDQDKMKATDVALLATGAAFLYPATSKPYLVQFPLPYEPFADCPNVRDRKLRTFLDHVFTLPFYSPGPQILLERADFTTYTIDALKRLKQERAALLEKQPAASLVNTMDLSQSNVRI